jgi:hypothetical protein
MTRTTRGTTERPKRSGFAYDRKRIDIGTDPASDVPARSRPASPRSPEIMHLLRSGFAYDRKRIDIGDRPSLRSSTCPRDPRDHALRSGFAYDRKRIARGPTQPPFFDVPARSPRSCIVERLAQTRTHRSRSTDDPPAQRSRARPHHERPTAPRTTDRTTNDRTNDRTTNDRATNDRTTNDRATNDRTTNDRTTNDRATNDRTTNDRTTNDRTTNDRTTNDRTTNDRTTNDRTTNDRATNGDGGYARMFLLEHSEYATELAGSGLQAIVCESVADGRHRNLA